MKLFSLSLFALVTFQSAQAGSQVKVTPGIFWASYIAQHISSVKTAADMARVMPLTSQDRASYLGDLKKQNALQSKVPSFDLKDASISFAQKSFPLTIGYTEVQNGFLTLNGKRWATKDLSSYSLARKAVESSTGKNAAQATFRDWLLPQAWATPIDYLKSFYASVIGLNLGPESLVASGSWALPELIINGYKNDFARQGADVSSVGFRCQGNELTEVKRVVFATNGKRADESFNTLRIESGIISGRFNGCQFSADSSGKILTAKGDLCPDSRRNLFDQPPHFKFPLIAKQCCELSGCYEKVTSALDSLQQKAVDQANPPPAEQ